MQKAQTPYTPHPLQAAKVQRIRELLRQRRLVADRLAEAEGAGRADAAADYRQAAADITLLLAHLQQPQTLGQLTAYTPAERQAYHQSLADAEARLVQVAA